MNRVKSGRTEIKDEKATDAIGVQETGWPYLICQHGKEKGTNTVGPLWARHCAFSSQKPSEAGRVIFISNEETDGQRGDSSKVSAGKQPGKE